MAPFIPKRAVEATLIRKASRQLSRVSMNHTTSLLGGSAVFRNATVLVGTVVPSLHLVGVLHPRGWLDNVDDTLGDLAVEAVVGALVGILCRTVRSLAGNVELSVASSHVRVWDGGLGHDGNAVDAVRRAQVFALGASIGLLARNVEHTVGGPHVRVRHRANTVVDDVRDLGWFHAKHVAV